MLDPFYLAKIARSFSRSWGVTVVVGGAGSIRTDLGKRTIYLPETLSSLPDEMSTVVEGALDHEVSHIRAEVEFPDDPPSGYMERAPDGEASFAMNIVEDIRIELDAGRRWLGVASHLEAFRAWGEESNRKAHDEGKLPLRGEFIGAFVHAGLTGEVLSWLTDGARALIEEAAPIIEMAKLATSPADSWAAAQPLAEILRRISEEKVEEPEVGEGEVGEGEVGEGEVGEGEVGEGEAPPGPVKLGRGAQCGCSGSFVSALSDLGLEKAIGDPGRYIPHPSAAKADEMVKPKGRRPTVDLSRAAPYVGGLASRMANLLRVPVPVPTRESESGRLDVAALPSLLTGERRVFYTDVRAEKNSTAVILLIDGSGSMGGPRIEHAAYAAYAIGEVLHRIGGAFEVLSWDDRWLDLNLTPDEAKVYTRISKKVIVEYKTFSEDWVSRRASLGFIESGDCNDDGGTIRQVLPRLLARPERKKILIVLSDGQPNHDVSRYIGQAPLNRHLIDAVSMAKSVGVRIGAVGIQSKHVKDFYPQHAFIDSLGDLPGAVLDLFGRLAK